MEPQHVQTGTVQPKDVWSTAYKKDCCHCGCSETMPPAMLESGAVGLNQIRAEKAVLLACRRHVSGARMGG